MVFAVAGCGGGGSDKDLVVAFSYPDQTTAYAWDEVSVPATLDGLDGNSPKCRVTVGSLPAGVSLNGHTCVVSGKPVETGSFSATVRLEVDGYKGYIDKFFDLNVEAPRAEYPAAEAMTAGEPTTSAAPAWTGYSPQPGDLVRYSVDARTKMPAGLSLDASTGVISGTPSELVGVGSDVWVNVEIERGGDVVRTTAVFPAEVKPPQIRYADMTLAAGETVTVTPDIPAFLAAGGHEIQFDSVHSDCGWLPLHVYVDAGTGVLQGTTTEELPRECQVTVYWSAKPFSVGLNGQAVLYFRPKE